MKTYKAFPDNDQFILHFKEKDLYNFGNRNYWLRRFENHNRKEHVNVEEYTIEHILPQNKNLPEKWQQDLGNNWKEIQEKYLHTLGNLTLTGYNSEYRDKPFHDKCNMEHGFRDSPLRLNKSLSNINIWNEQSIQKRAAELSERAISIWPLPTLSEATITLYLIKEEAAASKVQSRTIDSLKYMQEGASRDLFDMLESHINLLDENIEFIVNSKSIIIQNENIVAEIIPQKNKLRLDFYIPYTHLSDPKRMCTEIEMNKKGAIEKVRAHFSEAATLTYFINILKQAVDYQLSNTY